MTARRTLRIIEDTRQQISRAQWFPKEVKGQWIWNVEIVESTMPTGDYSLEGWTGYKGEPMGISIEWKKSLDEIAGNMRNHTLRTDEEVHVIEERKRFKASLERMKHFERKLLVICEPLESFGDPRVCRNQWDRNSFVANLHRIEEGGVAVKFFQNERNAAVRVLAAIRRFAESKRKLEVGERDATPTAPEEGHHE